MLNLRTGPHLAVIAAEEKIATLWSGDVIRRIIRIEFVPVLRRQDPSLVSEDEATLRLVQETLENLPLYYCLTRDISRSCYPKSAGDAKNDAPAPPSTDEDASAPSHASAAAAALLWRSTDPAFTWNFHMCRTLLEAGKFIWKSFRCSMR
jgi:hypothetical protein